MTYGLWKTSQFAAGRASFRTFTGAVLVTVRIGTLVATDVSCSGDDIPAKTKDAMEKGLNETFN